ncbi:hypothetical protein Pmani_018020 [Petrolisthes manimaculis]|uniref:RRM domain-containing protein n=2 Tax=Petrolisthes TaxID=84661 RepID=A0AAE1U743_9EUCA|nr:hypothetical protein Pmani_018020 [Petrolisthes manimaculis]
MYSLGAVFKHKALKMPPKTKIFVGKLPPTCKDFELRKLFERFGEVTECSILGNYAFVHMKTESQAAAAIGNLNNWDMNGFKISVEQSTGEKRAGGMGGMGRGGMGGGFRGRGGPMRGRGMGRPGPYDRRPPMGDRYGPPPPGPPPAPPMRNGYYDDYERRDRRPLPPAGALDRRPPPPMPREPAYRDPYDRYDSYDRMPPPPMGRRTPPPMDRRPPPPMGYDRRDDPYGDMYGPRPERDMYGGGRDMFPPRGRSPPRRSPPRRYPGPPRDMPSRRF